MHEDLAGLLRQRLQVIADHEFRDRDSAAHLDTLKSASEKIAAWHQRHRRAIPARLDHFLTNSSFEKALRFLESGGTWTGH